MTDIWARKPKWENRPFIPYAREMDDWLAELKTQEDALRELNHNQFQEIGRLEKENVELRKKAEKWDGLENAINLDDLEVLNYGGIGFTRKGKALVKLMMDLGKCGAKLKAIRNYIINLRSVPEGTMMKTHKIAEILDKILEGKEDG